MDTFNKQCSKLTSCCFGKAKKKKKAAQKIHKKKSSSHAPGNQPYSTVLQLFYSFTDLQFYNYDQKDMVRRERGGVPKIISFSKTDGLLPAVGHLARRARIGKAGTGKASGDLSANTCSGSATALLLVYKT